MTTDIEEQMTMVARYFDATARPVRLADLHTPAALAQVKSDEAIVEILDRERVHVRVVGLTEHPTRSVHRGRRRALVALGAVTTLVLSVAAIKSGADRSVTTSGSAVASAAAGGPSSTDAVSETGSARSTVPASATSTQPSSAAETEPSAAPTTSQAATGDTLAVTSILAELPDPGDVSLLPQSPISGRSSPASVWTGTELVVWGGDTDGGADGPAGAAFNPTTNTWRVLAPAPISPRSHAAVVWTGTEMVVWGGAIGSSVLADGAAYNPRSDTWRTLSTSPLSARAAAGSVWTGTEMIIVGGSPLSVSLGPGDIDPRVTGARYDPSTDTWAGIANSPGAIGGPYPLMVWTGTKVLAAVWPAGLDGHGKLQARLGAYDPQTDDWTVPDDPPPADAVLGSLVLISEPGPDATVAAMSPVPSQPSFLLDANGDVRQELAPRPLDPFYQVFLDPIWSGTELISWRGNPQGLAFDPIADSWRIIAAGPLPPQWDGAKAWTGSALIAWGGSRYDATGNLIGADQGIRYTPDGSGATAPVMSSEWSTALSEANDELPRIRLAPEPDHHLVLGLGPDFTIETRGDVHEVRALCVTSTSAGVETGRICANRPDTTSIMTFSMRDPDDPAYVYFVIATAASSTISTTTGSCAATSDSNDGNDVEIRACRVPAPRDEKGSFHLTFSVAAPEVDPIEIEL